jgi:hypothetical protein
MRSASVWLLRNLQETVQCVLYPVRLLRNSKESVHNSFYMWFGAWTRICEIRSVSYLALEELTRICAMRSVSCLALEEFTRICAFLLCPVRLLRNSQEWYVLSLYIWFGSWAIHSSCNFLLRECGSWRKQEEAATKIKGCREEGFMSQWSHLENVFPAVFCMSWEQHMVCIWSADDCKRCWIQQLMRRMSADSKVFVLFEEVRSLQNWFCSQVECIILKNEVSGMESYQRLTCAME